MPEHPRAIHADLIAWGVLEPDAPMRFTDRFRASLARAAKALQEEGREEGPGVQAIEHQVTVALAEVAARESVELTQSHRALTAAVHVESLPPGLRTWLGV